MPDTGYTPRYPIIGPYPPRFSEEDALSLMKRHFGANFNPQDILQLLTVIVHHAGHLSARVLEDTSRMTNVSLADLRALTGFYSFLDQPLACRYRIQVSTNIIDTLAGADESLDFLSEHYRLQADIAISATSCTGFSDLAPGALINGIPVTGFTVARARQVADLIDAATPMAEWPVDWFNTQSTIHVRDILLQQQDNPATGFATASTTSRETFLEQLKASGLRGRGGAGFPSWQKWSTAKATEAAEKYVVCNADEGEPGTFKDRVLLEQHFDDVIDGMRLCGWVIGANTGLIYLRGEYAWLYDRLVQRLQIHREKGLLQSTPSHAFDIYVHLGAGAYICGEESALIESLEGKRGIPRIRPPFPATHGFRNAPTVVNNVETYCAASWIARHSAQAFAALGTAGSTGTKLHSVSGDCKFPGIYELPFGTTVSELLRHCGAENTGAVQVGGPSGRLLFADQFDTPVDFAHVSSGGSYMVFSTLRDPLEIVANFSRFFAHESCGFCTPCRAGTQVLTKRLQQIREGQSHPQMETELRELTDLMQVTSHCGLGQTAGNPFRDLLNARPALLRERLGSNLDRVFLRSETP